MIDLNDEVWIWGQHDYIPNIQDTPTRLNMKALDLSLGLTHIMLLDLDHNVWIWGDNEFGQLGLGENILVQPTPFQLNFKATKIYANESSSFIIDLDKNVWATGDNSEGKLGLKYEQIPTQFTQIPNLKGNQISSGFDFTIFVGTYFNDN
jgi:alpha-tubulin suppressor-like RCC1 family protein